MSLTGRQDVLLDCADENRVRRLFTSEPLAATLLRHPLGLDDLTGGEGRGPDVANLAGAHQVTQRPQRLVDIRVLLGAMDLVKIDPVCAQTPQTPLDLLRDPAARVAELVRVIAHGAVHLRRKNHVVAATALQCLPHDFLGLAAGIHVGGIDEVDAPVEGPVDDADGVVVVGIAPRAEHHRSQAERADLHSSATQCPKLHSRALPQMMASLTTRRPALGRRAATIATAYAFFVTMVGTTLPTP